MGFQKDGSGGLVEQVSYNLQGFPLYVRRGKLSYYSGYGAPSHWHEDLEFIRVSDGQMLYNVNGETTLLRAGEGIFVNSRQLHRGYSKDGGDCDFVCVLVSPALLCASPRIVEKYVSPVVGSGAMPWLALHDCEPRAASILDSVARIYDAADSEEFEIEALSQAFLMLKCLHGLVGGAPAVPPSRSADLARLKAMIAFVCAHYAEDLSLSSICAAGDVGKTRCCELFKEYTNETPVSYLERYRLRKAAELLESGDEAVSRICFEAGFRSASYFDKRFRGAYGCTPTQYRAAASHGSSKQ